MPETINDSDLQEPFYRLVAIDPDTGKNADIRYNIKTRNTKFSINHVTGELYAIERMDNGEVYELSVGI